VSDEPARRSVGPIELFRAFLVIGLTAFGVAALQDVRSVPVRRGWLELEDVDEGLGVVQLYPGATMMDLVAYVGYRTGRIRGAIAAAAGFVAPSLLLVLGLSWAYVEYGALGPVGDLLVGLNAIVVGVIANVGLDFAGQHLRGWLGAALASMAFAVALLGGNVLWVVPGALIIGAAFMAPRSSREPRRGVVPVSRRRLALSLVPAVVVAAGVVVAAVLPGILAELTVTMAKVGAVAFGNGYTILPVLQQNVVDVHHWLSLSAFGAGIAFGQLTPGPILITAVFVGFVVAGWWGSILAAVAIFAPSVAMTIVAAEIYPALRGVAGVRGAITGVMAAFVGLLASVVVVLGRQIVEVPAALVLASCSLAAVRLLRWNLLAVFAAGLAAWAVYLGLNGLLHR
jgi:chromate transporter